eukprot:8543464-Pyramimonas_sp.AAC.2
MHGQSQPISAHLHQLSVQGLTYLGHLGHAAEVEAGSSRGSGRIMGGEVLPEARWPGSALVESGQIEARALAGVLHD